LIRQAIDQGDGRRQTGGQRLKTEDRGLKTRRENCINMFGSRSPRK